MSYSHDPSISAGCLMSRYPYLRLTTFTFLVVFVVFALWIAGCTHKNPPVTIQTQTLPPASPTAATLTQCKSVDGLPDSACTPGAVRTTTVDEICKGGSARPFRPPVSYTNALKRSGIVAYGYADTNMWDYEEDHLISLELGGSGDDPRDLWPEPHEGKYNFYVKDRVENWLRRQVCSGAMTPEEAQKGIATDWRQYLLPAISGQGIEKKRSGVEQRRRGECKPARIDCPEFKQTRLQVVSPRRKQFVERSY
jgi:hypothetical protein